MNPKVKRILLIVALILMILSAGLVLLDLFVVNVPAWTVVLCAVVSIACALAYAIAGKPRPFPRIAVPVLSLLLAGGSALTAELLPYWNSCLIKGGEARPMGYDEPLTYAQAEHDLDTAMRRLKRTHPLFRSGLTEEVQERRRQSEERLQAMEEITVNDLYRELQSILSPLHDAHTTAVTLYRNERTLRCAAQMQEDGYHFVSVNGYDREGVRALAAPYTCYESEDWINPDVGTLSRLQLYGLEAPYTFVWENAEGEQRTETYEDQDFRSVMEYVASSKELTPAAEPLPFVRYETDPERSLAILTLQSCQYNDLYKSTLRDLFTEVQRQGLRHVAVDLRGNGGGNSLVADELIRYLPAERYDGCSCDLRLNLFSIPLSSRDQRNRQYTDLTFDGDLYILTDRYSFSSAMMFPQMIQDNGLGKVIGEPPANSTNSFGDVVLFSLPESGLLLQVSTKRWYRIDQSAPDFLVPDYPCDGTEALDTLYALLDAQK